MSSSRVLLISAVLVGLVTLSSCRSLGEMSEQKTYSSAPSYGGSPTPTSGSGGPSAPTYGVPEIPKHGFVGTSDYWKSHPDMINAAVGSLGYIGKTFSFIVGKYENLHDALYNTITDGVGALLREGAAAYLNSIVNKKFPFSTQQVKESIVMAMTSDAAASAQAGIFKKANEYHY